MFRRTGQLTKNAISHFTRALLKATCALRSAFHYAFRLHFHPAFDKRRHKSNEERSLERIFFYPREVALFIIVPGTSIKTDGRGRSHKIRARGKIAEQSRGRYMVARYGASTVYSYADRILFTLRTPPAKLFIDIESRIRLDREIRPRRDSYMSTYISELRNRNQL